MLTAVVIFLSKYFSRAKENKKREKIDISIDGIVGNLIENTTGSFIQKAVMGFDDIAEDSDVVFDPKVGLDWLVSKGLTTGLAAGSPVGIAGNVIGALL